MCSTGRYRYGEKWKRICYKRNYKRKNFRRRYTGSSSNDKIESNKTNHTHEESLFSGIDGSFIFPALCKGNYILTAEAAGYITAEKTIDLNSGTLNFIELELSESAFVMDEVVVSASRNEISRKSAIKPENFSSCKRLWFSSGVEFSIRIKSRK